MFSPIPLGAQEKITFQDHIRPIFETACSNCHNPDKKKGGLDLTSFVTAMTGGSSGEVVNAGAAADSRLFKSVSRIEEPFMPPQGAPLGAKEIELIKKWIDGGLLETASGVARKAKKPAFEMKVAAVTSGKPEGPPPMPENLLLEPVVRTQRAQATGALASSPWAPLVAISGQHQALLYNSDTLELAGVLPFADGFIEALNFSRNGQLLVGGGGRGGKSGKVIVWEIKTGKRVVEVGEERDTVLGADITADQSIVALGGPSRHVKLYQTANGELLKDIKKHTDWVTAIQFSPDGVLLASGDRAGNLYVWEARTGNDFFALSGHSGAITSLSWRGDSNVLASASKDGTIRLWEMNEGKEVKKWNAHGGGVQSISFTHDGRIVSCGRDSHVKTWKQDGAQQVAQNQFADLPLAACFTHNGERIVVGDWSGRITVWNSADAKPAGEMSAAPPGIDDRLAALKPEVQQSEQALTAARDVLGSMANNITVAQHEVEEARHSLENFQSSAGSVEASLARARSTAEGLLERLKAPMPPPAETAASMDVGAAKALAEDLLLVTARAKETLISSETVVGDFRPVFATLPDRLAATVRTVRDKEKDMAQWRQKADEAQKAVDSATAALTEHQRSLARWEAAKVNVGIIGKRNELDALTAQLEDVTAELEALRNPGARLPLEAQAGQAGTRQAGRRSDPTRNAREAEGRDRSRHHRRQTGDRERDPAFSFHAAEVMGDRLGAGRAYDEPICSRLASSPRRRRT